MRKNVKQMKHCIDACNACGDSCEQTLFRHCLEMGGEHVEPAHVRLMADCAEICRVAANFMLRGSDMHAEVCRACAEVCETCAGSCEDIGGAEMERCADICRECADACRDMSGVRSVYRQQGGVGMMA